MAWVYLPRLPCLENEVNNFPPFVSVFDSTVQLGQQISLAGRFSVSDIDPNPVVTRYRFRDSNTSPQSGYFRFRGQVWQQGLILEVSAADLVDVTYQSGAVVSSELITVEAFDGVFWSQPGSGTIFSVVPNVNPPVVTGSNVVVTALERVPVADFISAFDPDGFPILEYRFIDGSADPNGGYFALNGVRMPSVTWFSVAPNQLGSLEYVGALYGTQEQIAVLARDEGAFSNLTFFAAITNPNSFNPTVVANNTKIRLGQKINVSQLFSYSDLDGNSLKWVRVNDLGVAANSGFFELDGVRQPGGSFIQVNGNELGRLNYVAGPIVGAEQFQVQVWDGQRLSTVATGNAITTDLPIVEVADILLIDSFEQIRLADRLSVTTSVSPLFYEFIDLNDAPTSGRLIVNGQELAAHKIQKVSAANFAQTFVRGGADDLGRSFDEYVVRVDNGFEKSAWASINVSTDPVNEKAVLGLGFWNFDTPKLDLSYNFPEVVPQYYCTLGLGECTNWQNLSDVNMRAAIRDVLDTYENFINVTFTEVTATTLADITFMLTDAGNDGTLAYARPPGIDNLFDPRGDVWGNFNHPLLFESQPGGTGYATWIHELGHSMGLEHPFAFPEEQAGSPPHLPTSMQNNRFSIMSYERVFTDPLGNEIEPITPQLYDVMALQTLYGKNPTYRAGATHIKIDPNSPIPQTIYDSGGFDTLNLTNHVVSVTVDLRQGQFSSVGGIQENIAIAWGVDIENARGGAGSDFIQGNELNNLLFGNAGNDVLRGNGGSDLLRGHGGNDTYVWAIGDGFDVINEELGAGRDFLDIQLFDEYDFGMETLSRHFSFRRFGNDLRVDISFDGEASHGGVRITDMGFGRNRVETMRLFDVSGDQIGPEISLFSVFNFATVTPHNFRLTNNTSNYGNLAVPIA